MIRRGSSIRPLGFADCGLHQLVEQPPRRRGKAAIGLLLNPMRDAAPEQIRTERLWRIGPEQLAVALARSSAIGIVASRSSSASTAGSVG